MSARQSHRVLVRCDGAAVPLDWRAVDWTDDEQILTDTTHPAFNLFIQGLELTPLETMSARTEDLIRIGAFAYRADQLISRGGRKDPHARQWSRTFGLCIPVRDLAFWERSDVQAQLASTLGYATGDVWQFGFSALPYEAPVLIQRRTLFSFLPREAPPGSIVLFSGGLDSLATLAEARRRGERPLALGHWSAEFLQHQQEELIRAFNQMSPDCPSTVLFGVKIHARNDEAVERSRRTRGFLFACLGGAVAGELGVERVYLADNGPISLNLPINHQLLGAHVSRSTHPVFLARVNQLMALVFEAPVIVSNPLWARTRVDVLHLLRDTGLVSLIPMTNSCSRWSRQPVATPFCGTCSQCVDRRFATMAAGLEAADQSDRYATDVFWDHLINWEEEMLAVSYVRFAQRIVAATPDDLMMMFPELFDAISPEDPDPDGTLGSLLAMLRRHAQAIIAVLERQMIDAAARMARGELVP